MNNAHSGHNDNDDNYNNNNDNNSADNRNNNNDNNDNNNNTDNNADNRNNNSNNDDKNNNNNDSNDDDDDNDNNDILEQENLPTPPLPKSASWLFNPTTQPTTNPSSSRMYVLKKHLDTIIIFPFKIIIIISIFVLFFDNRLHKRFLLLRMRFFYQ